MNKKQNNTELRSILFKHLDGIVLLPSIAALNKGGIVDLILQKKSVSLSAIQNYNQACNLGYINIALRLLSSQGIVLIEKYKDKHDITYSLTEHGKKYLSFIDLITSFAKLIPFFSNMNHNLFNTSSSKELLQISTLIKEYKNIKVNKNNVNIFHNIEGLIIGPFWVAIGMDGLFSDITEKKHLFNNFSGNKELLNQYIQLLKVMGWLDNDKYASLTKKGFFFAKRAMAYGVTVSYLHTFKQFNNLFYGNPNIMWEKNKNEPEKHVDRTMNVWGSGGAHLAYFKKIDEIIIKIFNAPINNQPAGISDMGCGDGTFLKHLYELIIDKTKRGKYIKDYPLTLIGADYNKAALVASKKTLTKIDTNKIFMHADISNPNKFAKDLQKKHAIDLKNLLNVRSFLDHNRIFKDPENFKEKYIAKSTGAFSFRGKWLSNSEVEQNLIEHFNKWAPFIKRYGLIVLELHTIDSSIAAKNIGNTISTAYDGTHGFSDQYIVEYPVFLHCAKIAGINKQIETITFPNKKIGTISINWLK